MNVNQSFRIRMKHFLFWLFMSLCLFGLASCAAEDPGTAVAYLDALNTRDLETARDLVCEARQDDVTMGLVTVDDVQVEPFEFTNVSCSAQGGDVMCRFNIRQATEHDAVSGVSGIDQTFAREVIFNFEDGRICGFEEQVSQ